MGDFLSNLYGNQNTAGNFNTVTPSFDASSLYSSSGSFTDSLVANGGVDVTGGLSNGTQQAGTFSDFFSNDQGGQGWGVPALGAATGIANTFLGFQQLSEGKKQNAIAQNQWQQQFDIQKTEYDRRVSERADRIANADAAKAKAGLGG